MSKGCVYHGIGTYPSTDTRTQFYQGNDPLQLERVRGPFLEDYYTLIISFVSQVGVYFTEVENAGGKTKYVPRSVQVDLESGVCDRVCEIETFTCFRNIHNWHMSPDTWRSHRWTLPT